MQSKKRIRSLAVVGSIVFAMVLVLGVAQPSQAQSGVSNIWSDFWSTLGAGGNSGKENPEGSQQGAESDPSGSANDGKTTKAEARKTKQGDSETVRGWANKVWRFPIFKTGDSWIRLNQLV